MSDVSERIPEEVLASARLRLKRRVAAVLITAMADSGMTYSEVDTRIGERPGFTRRYINRLIDGSTRDFDLVSDLACGMGVEVEMRAVPLFNLQNEPAQSTENTS